MHLDHLENYEIRVKMNGISLSSTGSSSYGVQESLCQVCPSLGSHCKGRLNCTPTHVIPSNRARSSLLFGKDNKYILYINIQFNSMVQSVSERPNLNK